MQTLLKMISMERRDPQPFFTLPGKGFDSGIDELPSKLEACSRF
jgi:hypothetical protein